MRRAGILLALVMALCVATAVAVAEEPLPPQGPPPAGANDFACKPPARHPFPVVLVHGTLEDMQIFNAIGPSLQRLGYCVFALDYGNKGSGDIRKSAGQLLTFVKRVLQRTEAEKVAMVGHSQGGMMPRYLVKFLGGGKLVTELVGISPSNHGTTNPAAAEAAAGGCVACGQQVAGSEFLRKLNAGDETPGPLDYTVVQTNQDTVVTPYESAFLSNEPRVTNVLLQTRCPSDPSGHNGIVYDPVAIQWVLNALGRPGPADRGFEPDCTGQALGTYPDSFSVAPAKLRLQRPASRTAQTSDRRIRVPVSAEGGPVRKVRILIHAGPRNGPVVGRSGMVRVGEERRRVLVALGRPLEAGRYVATAKGTDPTGRTARGFRAFELRRSP